MAFYGRVGLGLSSRRRRSLGVWVCQVEQEPAKMLGGPFNQYHSMALPWEFGQLKWLCEP